MTKELLRFTFTAEVQPEDAEAALLLAIFATESIHSESRMLIEGRHYFDARHRVLLIDVSSKVGQDLSCIFTGFLRREIPQDCFEIERIHRDAEPGFAPAHS